MFSSQAHVGSSYIAAWTPWWAGTTRQWQVHFIGFNWQPDPLSLPWHGHPVHLPADHIWQPQQSHSHQNLLSCTVLCIFSELLGLCWHGLFILHHTQYAGKLLCSCAIQLGSAILLGQTSSSFWLPRPMMASWQSATCCVTQPQCPHASLCSPLSRLLLAGFSVLALLLFESILSSSVDHMVLIIFSVTLLLKLNSCSDTGLPTGDERASGRQQLLRLHWKGSIWAGHRRWGHFCQIRRHLCAFVQV